MKQNNPLIKKTTLLVVFLIFASVNAFSLNQNRNSFSNIPDFAYPQTVERNSRVSLQKAIAKNKPVDTLRAFLDLIVAANKISKQNVIPVIQELDSVAGTLHQPYSAIGYLLEADLLKDIYLSNRRVFDNRVTVSSLKEANPQFWDKAIFSQKIDSLISLALMNRKEAERLPLNRLKNIISIQEPAESFTLYDFIVYKAASILNIFNDNNEIPFFHRKNNKRYDPIFLIDELISIHHKISPARVAAVLERVNYMKEGKQEFLLNEIKKMGKSPHVVPLLIAYSNLIKSEYGQENRITPSLLSFVSYLCELRNDIKNSKAKRQIQNLIDVFNAESVSVSFPNLVSTSEEIQVEVKSENIGEFFVLCISTQLPSQERLTLSNLSKYTNKIDERFISNPKKKPFFCDTTLTFNIASPGNYSFIVSRTPDIDGILIPGENIDLSIMEVSDIDIIGINQIMHGKEGTDNLQGCFIVNTTDGAPIENATVSFKTLNYEWDPSSKKQVQIKKTDKEGFASTAFDYSNAEGEYLGSKASLGVYRFNGGEQGKDSSVRLFVDRSVYKPGDSINFMGIAYHSEGNKACLEENKEMQIRLKNANLSIIDSLRLKTDFSGRITGSMKIPTEGLLGSWSLWATSGTNNENILGAISFDVAEYKVPSFYVNIHQKQANSKEILFEGSAFTYSGLPLQNVIVTYQVEYTPSPYFYYVKDKPSFFSSHVWTDIDGLFKIVLPLENLKIDQYKGTFTIKASVTDNTGETVETNGLHFWLSPSYNIVPEIPSKILADSPTYNFKIRVNDLSGKAVKKEVEYQLLNEKGDTVGSGEFLSPDLKLDLSVLPSSKYTLKFRMKETENEDADCEFIIYRATDSVPPVKTPIWVPQSRIVASNTEKEIEITYGSTFPGQYILIATTNSMGKQEFNWIKSEGHNNKLSIKAPGDNEKVFVKFIAYRNHNFYIESVEVLPENITKKLSIKTETFRNNLEPGAKEEWQFKLQLGDGPISGYAYSLLFDKALEAISPLYWNGNLFTPSFYDFISVNGVYSYTIRETFKPQTKFIPFLSQPEFEFQTYGYPLYGNLIGSGVVTFRKSSNSSMKRNFESSLEETMVEDVSTGAVATSSADELFEEEGGEGNEPVTKFRPGEMPVGFFKPLLVSDQNGIVSIPFTTPDFNTTWVFLMGAYTKDLDSDLIRLETTASKKIMVNLLAPRFIRTGDNITFTAKLYNNLDSVSKISSSFEIFNPENGKSLKNRQYKDISIEGYSGKLLSIEFECPDSINAIGLRVFAETSSGKDGEQTIIPVFPSSQPLIESYPFYLAGESEIFKMEIPHFKEGSNVTFKYLNNPMWEVIKSLPPLIADDSESLTSQISSLYANSVGFGIVNKFPEIKEGLNLLVNGDAEDSVLISNLSKDQDLKYVSLNNTPWVNNAANETLRVFQLKSLLQPELAKATINQNWAKIMELRNPDGGFSWCKGMKSRTYITQLFLSCLGQLFHSGYLEYIPEAKTVVNEAVQFVDGENVTSFYNYGNEKDNFYKSLISYLYVRSFFPESKTSFSLNTIINQTVHYIEKNWKSLSLEHKAKAAIILWREGSLEIPIDILRSIKESSLENNEKGVWFENIDSCTDEGTTLVTTSLILSAFHEITPDDEIINKIKQWLLIQKQSQDWTGNIWSVDVINALITTGSTTHTVSPLPEIIVAGEKISENKFSTLVGEVSLDINLQHPYQKEYLRIKKACSSPAWGGFISQSIYPMKEITSFEINGLQIEKQICKIINTGNEIVVEPTDKFNLGDKIKVILTINNERDMDYVTLSDERGACMEPMNQLSGFTNVDGIRTYMETGKNATTFFFDFLPKGKHVISYECSIMEKGEFSAGIAALQCLYSPLLTSHSSGKIIKVE